MSDLNTKGLTSIPPAPEPNTRVARSVFAASLAIHGSLVWVLHVSAAEPSRVIPEQIEIELAPPPPPPPPPEPEKEPEPEPEPEKAPPPEPRPIHKPVPRLTPSATPAETAAKPEEIGTDIPQGEDGDLPPAPVGLAPPAPQVVAPPAPPPPPPPPPPVIEAREGANYANNPRPAYPRSALREGWQGRVVLRVRVLPNGKVESAKVQTSAGHDTLDEAALEIVKGWSFVPATQGGKPIAGWVSVPFEFKIQ